MPDLVRYQLCDGPHAGEPTTERGEIERLARECQAAECHAGLDSTVIEARFNVVRSSVPGTVTTDRRLRDYLSPADLAGAGGPLPRGSPGRSEPHGSGQDRYLPTGKRMRRAATPTVSVTRDTATARQPRYAQASRRGGGPG
jgi:hypothetical protein